MDTSQNITIHRTYQIRGYVCKTGFARVREVLGICKDLYNRALAERKAIYRLTGKRMSKYAQFKWLTGLRQNSQTLNDIDLQVKRGALIRVDRAYQNFFTRIDEYKETLKRHKREGIPPRRDGELPGYPRFKPWQRYTCLELASVRPGMVKRNRLKIKGLPLIRLQPNRPLPDSAHLKSLRIVLHGRILNIDLTYEETTRLLPANNQSIGIDLGINKRLTLSNGEAFNRRRTDITKQRRLQRSIARKKRGGKNRQKAVARLANFKRREAVKNRNECHRITTELVRRFDTIVIEGLQIPNMTRSGGSHKRGLNREIQGQTWGLLRNQLAYKVEWTGRQLIEVNPAYTSKICSVCGVVGGNPREYSTFECSECGHTEDRDVNAAKNILKRGWDSRPAGHNVEVVNSSVS